MKTVVAVLLAGVAAYALSFAFDLLLGGIIGVYPETAFLLVVTWSIISAVLLIVAIKLTRQRIWLVLPFAAFTIFALVGAIVGTHLHSYGVAVLLAVQSLIMWRVFIQQASVNGQP